MKIMHSTEGTTLKTFCNDRINAQENLCVLLQLKKTSTVIKLAPGWRSYDCLSSQFQVIMCKPVHNFAVTYVALSELKIVWRAKFQHHLTDLRKDPPLRCNIRRKNGWRVTSVFASGSQAFRHSTWVYLRNSLGFFYLLPRSCLFVSSSSLSFFL